MTEKFQGENKSWLAPFQWELVSEAVMAAMADTRTPQGVLAVARQKCYTLEEILQPKEGRPLALMVLETIQDPGNLGTIIRAGEGAGITGIVMNRDTADLYNPKVIRSTMGSILRMPFVYVDDLGEACLGMKERGVRLFAAHLKGMNNYDREDYTEPVSYTHLNFNFRVGLGLISELGYGMLFGSDVKKQFSQKRIKGRGYCDVGTSAVSYTHLIFLSWLLM